MSTTEDIQRPGRPLTQEMMRQYLLEDLQDTKFDYQDVEFHVRLLPETRERLREIDAAVVPGARVTTKIKEDKVCNVRIRVGVGGNNWPHCALFDAGNESWVIYQHSMRFVSGDIARTVVEAWLEFLPIAELGTSFCFGKQHHGHDRYVLLEDGTWRHQMGGMKYQTF